MNLLKAGGTAVQAALQASSCRGMHTTQRRDSLRVKRWLKRASETITHKAGNSNTNLILQTNLPLGKLSGGLILDLVLNLDRSGVRKLAGLAHGGPRRPCLQGYIEHPLERSRPARERRMVCFHLGARPEELVGDVQRGEYGQFEGIAGRRFPGGKSKLLIHVRCELGHV